MAKEKPLHFCLIHALASAVKNLTLPKERCGLALSFWEVSLSPSCDMPTGMSLPLDLGSG